jgi:hypothetical protein
MADLRGSVAVVTGATAYVTGRSTVDSPGTLPRTPREV